jgi:galactosylceramidase
MTLSPPAAESSHEHFEGDLSYNRGYEYRLMKEARRRNPLIRIYALEWSVPGWVGGDGAGGVPPAAADYSDRNRRYTLDWLRGARDVWNCSVDYLGFWNEPHALAPPAYVMAMRIDLDAAGFQATRLVALDTREGAAATYVRAMANDSASINSTALQRAIHAFGFHGGPTVANGASWLPQYRTLDPATRPRLFASEDGNLPCSMSGARSWGRTHLANWLSLNVTATVRWSVIWAAYPGTICNGCAPDIGNRGGAPARAHWAQ